MAEQENVESPPLVQVEAVTLTLQRLQHSGVLAGDCATQLRLLERLEEHAADFHVRLPPPVLHICSLASSGACRSLKRATRDQTFRVLTVSVAGAEA
jgi:hypothetical protein